MPTQVIPVIHYANDEQAIRNAGIAFGSGCAGVMLIHMEGRNDLLMPIAHHLKKHVPEKLVGINFLGMDVEEALAINIAAGLDMTWTDEQVTHTSLGPWPKAKRLRDMLGRAPDHLLFTGVAFKHQRHEPHPATAAREAAESGFIPTTSGPATGVAAEVDKIADLRRSLGPDLPLAIASGVTPANAHEFAPHLTHILVASGVSSSFHEFDVGRLCDLQTICESL